MIFKEFASNPSTQYSCHISYLEIYNESGFDLLDPSHETKALEDLPRVRCKCVPKDDVCVYTAETTSQSVSTWISKSDERSWLLFGLGQRGVGVVCR